MKCDLAHAWPPNTRTWTKATEGRDSTLFQRAQFEARWPSDALRAIVHAEDPEFRELRVTEGWDEIALAAVREALVRLWRFCRTL